MPPHQSSARFISYDLRPAKQSERRIIVDILRIASDVGLPIREYRYVGMGANRFYDFILFHKYLGISSMISLERDPNMFKRSLFNVPFGFIDVQNVSVEDFLLHDASDKNTVYWLDYDGGVGKDLVSDISILMDKIKPRDIFFITVNGNPPYAIGSFAVNDRLTWLKDEIGPSAGTVEAEDVERSTFWKSAIKIVNASIKSGLAQRTEAKALTVLEARYSDSMEMITVGGAFLVDADHEEYSKKLGEALPFLAKQSTYRIISMNLTERERVLFDLAATKPAGAPESTTLTDLGFSSVELNAYGELMRYLPRYVETHI